MINRSVRFTFFAGPATSRRFRLARYTIKVSSDGSNQSINQGYQLYYQLQESAMLASRRSSWSREDLTAFNEVESLFILSLLPISIQERERE